MQGFTQLRSADRASENEEAANADLQSPYFIKLLSGAPLTDHINAYFYGIFAEKGENSEVLIEDAWLRHDDVFGTGIEATLGQFQVSDLMFPREVRLPFQDYIPYRMAGITYERGLLLERGVGPVDLGLGFVNGNGIKESRNLTASGFNRSDHSFDNDDRKAVFGRIGTDIAGVGVGLFGYTGAQPNGFQQEAANINGGIPDHEASKDIVGLDLSGKFTSNVYWHAQGLYNRWDDFLENGEDYSWSGAFAGVDWIPNRKWAFSMLYNYADANDFDRVRLSDFASINAGSVEGTFANNRYDGLNLNTITFTSSYYFASNVRGVIEANGDLQSTNDFRAWRGRTLSAVRSGRCLLGPARPGIPESPGAAFNAVALATGSVLVNPALLNSMPSVSISIRRTTRWCCRWRRRHRSTSPQPASPEKSGSV